MPNDHDPVPIRPFDDPGAPRDPVAAPDLPALIAADTLDLEDEYLHDPPASTWQSLWTRSDIPLPAHWRELMRHRRAELDDRKERVRRGEWKRAQYLVWRAEQLRLAAGAGMPTQAQAIPSADAAAVHDGGWPDEPIPSHVREEYECIRPIGHGGSGSVYLVRKRSTHAECALKITRPGTGRDAVINELQSLERVRSPFVVGVRDYTRMTNGGWLIFTEYVPGMTLHAFRQSQPHGRITDAAMLERLLMGIARGLADLHQHGLVHRDLKPANIILRNGPGGTTTPVIIDLGMARGAQPAGMTLGPQGGTPGYLSPEQIEGRACTPASDVFAFGLIAYELVVGALMHGFQHRLFHEVCPALPMALEKLIKNECASASLERRIPNGSVLLERLTGAFSRGPARTSPASTVAGRRAPDEAAHELVQASEGPNHDPIDLDSRARGGDPQAMLQLARRLESADVTPTNVRTATHWYAKAAAAGHVDAMACLGWRMLRGIGTPAKPREAVQWIRRAADAGSAAATSDLGWCLLNGEGIDRDAAAAVRRYRNAADRGNTDGMTGLAWCLATGNGINADPKSAVGWYRRAADRGALGAMHDLGCCLLRGIGARPDPAEGVAWLRKAATGGLRPAMATLGWCLETGTGAPRNPHEAAQWYERAASAGDAVAMNDFGACLLHAKGVTADPAAAANWFKRSAEAGNPDAMLNLSQCLATGTGTVQNKRAAARWIQRARSAARNATRAAALGDAIGQVDESDRP